MAKFWLSESPKFSVIDQYAGRNATATTVAQKVRPRLSRCRERDWRAKNPESEHGAISWISFEGRSLPPAAAWSGYCRAAYAVGESLDDPLLTCGVIVCRAGYSPASMKSVKLMLIADG
jgi:hypothetical protein